MTAIAWGMAAINRALAAVAWVCRLRPHGCGDIAMERGDYNEGRMVLTAGEWGIIHRKIINHRNPGQPEAANPVTTGEDSA